MATAKLISIVIPVYNEGVGFGPFYVALAHVLKEVKDCAFEVIVVNDGSTDNTNQIVTELAGIDSHIRLISLSRNFGKELATSAGIHAATGDAIMTIDADGQHPVELIPEFIHKWQAGAKVVIGVRANREEQGYLKRTGSRWFYRLFNRISGIKITPGSTDFRLIDKAVQQDFNRLHENNRITRVLIDWLGYDREYVTYTEKPREHGTASQSNRKMIRLAIDSLISHSSSPLYYAAYLGLIILPLSLILGLVMLLDTLFGDPLNWNLTGTAFVVVLMLFLVGVLLISQGIIGLYLSQIQTEAKNRPLYIIDTDHSIRAD